MSGVSQAADVITLDELEQLIKFLGLLGSSHDGEVLAAARFATRWLVAKGTDWRTLLTPADEVGVVGVVAAVDPEVEAAALEAKLNEVYRNGVRDGMNRMAQQLKAQAAAVGLGAAQQSPWAGTVSFAGGHPAQNMAGAGLGGGLGGAGQANAAQGPLPPGAAQAPPVTSPAGLQSTTTWQDVAQTLLDRHASGIPGVFRGAKEETFVRDVLARGFRNLTPAQETWLRDIAGRSGMSW